MTQDLSWKPVPARFSAKTGIRVAVGLAAVALIAGGIAFYRSQPEPNAALPVTAAAPEAAPSSLLATGNTVEQSEQDDGLMGPPWPLDAEAGLRFPGPIARVEEIALRARQTPAGALQALGVSGEAIQGSLASLSSFIDFRRMRPGDTLKARFDAEDHLLALDVSRGFMEQARTRLQPEGWHGEKIEVAVDTVVAEVSGQVRTSLWDALVGSGGEDPRLVAALVDIFAYDIDFYTEIRQNDAFSLLVEKRYANGRFLEYGDVTAAEFYTGDQPHRAFLHATDNGTASYYDEQGRSLRKQLLKAPLKYAPVTSTFGVRRHPILGYTRNHNGTDYGVPVGTPVWSVGDGRVITAGWHGGFGRLVEVAHPNGWVSQYAHLSRINVRVGQRLQQKDVVGLVGMTGLSTGPHLHYGLKKNGHYVNSLAQKFERSPSLGGDELAAFSLQVGKLMQDLNKLRVAEQNVVPAPKPEKG